MSWFDPFASAAVLFTAPGARTRFLPAAVAGQPEALYAAHEPETAYREFNQDYYRVAPMPGGALLRPEPAALVAVRIDVSRLLDLRHPAVCAALQTNAAELIAPWKGQSNPTVTQQLGAAVFVGNWFEGILYHSVQHPGKSCVVLFRQRLLAQPAVHFKGYPRGAAPNTNSALADARLP